MMTAVVNHLWQSTLFAAIAAVFVFALRKNQARARHWIWLIASVKFLVPFSLLTGIGGHLPLRTAPATPHLSSVVQQVSQPFQAPELRFTLPGPVPGATPIPAMLLTIWLSGCAALLFVWCARWKRVAAVLRSAVPLQCGREYEALSRLQSGIRLASSDSSLEPGILGIFRPVLLLPARIADRLEDAQLEAILAHELCHIRRRDNLAAAVHMVVEALFWFHPLVWWLGARLIEERERACDEEVLRLGSAPEVYAEGILAACKHYLESPLPCMSGVTGSNLARRIERIMSGSFASKLSFGRKLLLGAGGFAAIAAPITIGLLHAQGPAAFEVASVKPNKSGARGWSLAPPSGGRLNARNVTLRDLIVEAYRIQEFQLAGGPGWLGSERYDVSAKADGNASKRQIHDMLQTLLVDRFQLKFHRETRELPIYALSVAKSGIRMRQADAGECPSPPVPNQPCGGFRIWMRSHISGNRVSMEQIADALSQMMGRTVVDKTGLHGNFDMKLEWTPDESQVRGLEKPDAPLPNQEGPSIFTALQEQLGLKMESQKGPVEVLVIDHAERIPAEN